MAKVENGVLMQYLLTAHEYNGLLARAKEAETFLDRMTRERDAFREASSVGWVSTEDRKPAHANVCLVAIDEEFGLRVGLGFYEGGYWFTATDNPRQEVDVTHWQEVPSLPQK